MTTVTDARGRSPVSISKPGMRIMYMLAIAAVMGVALAFASPTRDQWQALAPLLSAIAVVVMFGHVLLGRSRVFPLDDIGFWHVSFVSLYVVLPLAVFLALGLQYTPLNDSRLFSADPSPALVGRIGWYHVVYLACVASAYLWTVRRHEVPSNRTSSVPFEWALVAMLIWLFCELFFVGLGFFFQLSAESYLDAYVVVERLPLFARQFYRLVGGMRVVVSLVVLMWIMSGYSRRRWFLWAWLLLIVLETFVGGGSRTTLMTTIAATAILYHRFVRPLSLRLALAGAVVVIVGFTALGIRRQLQFAGEGQPTVGIGAGEFDAMFANALDLDQRVQNHEVSLELPALYLSELLAPVPSQLLPSPKRDLGIWYLDTFYPERREAGEGLAFGVIPQSLVGFGWPEIAVRAALIGWMLGLIARWDRRRGHRPWVVGIYLWFTVLSYQTFRNSTFVLLGMFVQQVIPTIVVLWVLSSLIAAARPRSRPSTALEGRTVV